MKRIAIVSLALSLVGALGGVAVAGVLGAVPDDGSSTASASAPRGYTGINDKALQSCMNEKRECSPVAAEHNKQVWSDPQTAGAATLDRSGVEALMRKNLGVSSSTPVYTAERSGAEAEGLTGMQRGANTDSSRLVWVVTVKTPMYTDGGPGTSPRLMQSYSAIVDAASGQVTDDCIGCSWLSSDM